MRTSAHPHPRFGTPAHPRIGTSGVRRRPPQPYPHTERTP
ncbi:hypothetical protein SFR_0089 [Streptomyces sp. FR-008]|nr:hypothetical protein SFR_0089 [Streptomyces sp. FR-008]